MKCLAFCLLFVLAGAAFAQVPPIPPSDTNTLAGECVTIAWDQSTDPAVVGYNIYYGSASRTYTNMLTVGNATNLTLGGLVQSNTYYIAATTYDQAGLESDYSSEITYTVPVYVYQPPTNVVTLTFAFSVSSNLVDWTQTNMSLTLTNPNGNLFYKGPGLKISLGH